MGTLYSASKPPCNMHSAKPSERQPYIYPDNRAAEAFLEHRRWPKGVACPDCKRRDVQYRERGSGRYQCKGCGRRWTVRQGTCMDGSRVSLSVWSAAILLGSEGLPESEFITRLVEITEIGHTTAKNLHQRMGDGPLPGGAEPSSAPAAPPQSSASPWPAPECSASTKRGSMWTARGAISFFSGAAICALAVWAFSTPPSPPAQAAPASSYVGALPIGDGRTAHVSYVQGVRIETPIMSPESKQQDKDRHLATVNLVRERMVKKPKTQPGE